MSPAKRAAVIGCDGQDGRLLCELLGRRGYTLAGIGRGRAGAGAPRWRRALDISRAPKVFDFVRRFRPDEIYYLAAFHHSSQDRPVDPLELFRRSEQVHVLSLVNVLEAMRRYSPATRLFYAATSHVFGAPDTAVQNENTPLAPINAYGATKAAGVLTCRYYRAAHGLHASVGILYNHESALRGPGFVSQKIVSGALEIKNGRRDRITLGDLMAAVDWGYAPDYVEAMRRILQLKQPGDFVVATGRKHTVRDFVQGVCRRLDLDWRTCVTVNPRLLTKQKFVLVGDSRKLRRLTGWKPSVDFDGMVDALLEAARRR